MLQSHKFSSAFAEVDNTPNTLTEVTYLRLRRDIIEGKLRPREKLRIEHLKDRYNASSGTLREALSQLLSDALVVNQGQRGFHVAPMSLTDLDDITRTRVLVEGEAMRRSISAGDDAWEANLIGAFHRLTKAEEKLGAREEKDLWEWEARNRDFHEALIGACDSRWLRYVIGLLYRQSERYRHLVISDRTLPRDVHAEHTTIFEAAIARDADAVTEAISVHIQLTCEAIRTLMPGLDIE
ncbi:FCD domain-containing protein [Massilia solisilvae]|uniref:FCD domain-containing protein n=1 Tax=Massilia solisilvae TaxID=1811225 RepID=A0ABT2BKV7_9BURK|nr:FCD domain-containing protein [Massilia solisilvae]MCS0609134.1 FCD domain-containing protein [Massilia solisilvae]